MGALAPTGPDLDTILLASDVPTYRGTLVYDPAADIVDSRSPASSAAVALPIRPYTADT